VEVQKTRLSTEMLTVSCVTHEVLDGNKYSTRNNRVNACYILKHNLSTFCSYFAIRLSEAEFKSDGLINLVEEISRQQA
jgi:hypothetical protein